LTDVLADTILKLVCADMQETHECKEFALVARALLGVPDEAIAREHRETLMNLLVSAVRARVESGSGSIETVRPIVSLMVKLMRRPTFYPVSVPRTRGQVHTRLTEPLHLGHGLLRHRRRCQSYCTEPDVFSGLSSGIPTFGGRAGDVDYQVSHFTKLVGISQLLTWSRQMTANVGAREEKYLRLAVSNMQELTRDALGGDDELTVFWVVLMKKLILAIRQSAAVKDLPGLNPRELELHLVELSESLVGQFCAKWAEDSSWKEFVPSVSVVLEAADDLCHHTATDKLSQELKKALSPYVSQLREASQKLGTKEDVDVWALRKYLTTSFSDDDGSFSKLGQTGGGAIRRGISVYGSWQLPTSEYGNREGILEYVDAVTADIDDDTKLKHIETLLIQGYDAPDQAAQLLAVHRIIQGLRRTAVASGSRTAGAPQDTFDLATAHTILCKRLRSTESRVEFILITDVLETMLDEQPNAMTQWNIELTLSTVSVLSSGVATHPVVSRTPKAYTRFCRLVQVIVRRHRLRLEGHFHLLVTTLQSLLHTLICHPFDENDKAWAGGLVREPFSSFEYWPKHARAFGRLLTMVCEPTPGSVARSQQSSLDSATDAAKRYAGQHMYLMLMLYIKLQLEQNVPHEVREALEPGVFAILDITTPAVRRIMNDALDASGRAIMKELYKQYLKFGKWSGI